MFEPVQLGFCERRRELKTLSPMCLVPGRENDREYFKCGIQTGWVG